MTTPSIRTRSRSLSLLVVVIVCAAWLATLPRLRMTTAITHFLPDMMDARSARLAKSITESELSRTLVLDLSGNDPIALGETATKLMAAIRELPQTTHVHSGFDEANEARVLSLLTESSPTALIDPGDLDDDAVVRRLQLLKTRLGTPLGPFIQKLAARDPLGGALGTFETMSELEGGRVTSRQGILYTADETHAFVFTSTRASAFDASAQRPYLDEIERAFLRVRSSPSEHLESSGVARMTVAAEAQIRGDIERIGGISTAAILLFFGVLFRSPRMLGLGLVPLWFGSALATIATHLVFGEIHGLTLAFGTSLLGVGIDYAEHYFAHFALTPEHGAKRVMMEVWPGLWMGALTTILGLAGLGLAGFPGVRQIAFFSVVAIVGALVGTRWLLPPWMPTLYARPRIMERFVNLAEGLVRRTRGKRWLILASTVIALLCMPGLLKTRFVDDVSVLLSLDPALLAEDARVRDRVSPVDPGRFVVVVREKEDEALEALDRTTRQLATARADGILEGYTPLGAVLRSGRAQRESFARARERRARIEEIMREQGFVPGAFAPFFRALDGDAPVVLTLANVLASPLGELVGSLSPRLPEGQAFVLPLRGVRDLPALEARLPDAIVIDETSLLEGTYARVRRRTTLMLGVGFALVLATLVVRYRAPRLVLAALLPGTLGALAAISIAGALGVPLNLLHFVGLLLVLSMGVDYGIFVVEGRATPENAARSLVSVATATTTTLLSFGLLALSKSPALRTLGTTITVGLLFSALLCPLASMVLVTSRTERADEPTR